MWWESAGSIHVNGMKGRSSATIQRRWAVKMVEMWKTRRQKFGSLSSDIYCDHAADVVCNSLHVFREMVSFEVHIPITTFCPSYFIYVGRKLECHRCEGGCQNTFLRKTMYMNGTRPAILTKCMLLSSSFIFFLIDWRYENLALIQSFLAVFTSFALTESLPMISCSSAIVRIILTTEGTVTERCYVIPASSLHEQLQKESRWTGFVGKHDTSNKAHTKQCPSVSLATLKFILWIDSYRSASLDSVVPIHCAVLSNGDWSKHRNQLVDGSAFHRPIREPWRHEEVIYSYFSRPNRCWQCGLRLLPSGWEYNHTGWWLSCESMYLRTQLCPIWSISFHEPGWIPSWKSNRIGLNWNTNRPTIRPSWYGCPRCHHPLGEQLLKSFIHVLDRVQRGDDLWSHELLSDLHSVLHIRTSSNRSKLARNGGWTKWLQLGPHRTVAVLSTVNFKS